MLKIFFTHDITNRDPEKRKRITGIMIMHGYQCGSSCYCNCASKCKYRKGYKFHNWSVAIHRFFEYRLHIKLPHFLYINKKWTDLSGTTKCPFKKERMYTCYDCKYQNGMDEYMNGLCGNKQYHNASYEESRHPTNSQICRFFEKSEWADRWDKNTGEKIYD